MRTLKPMLVALVATILMALTSTTPIAAAERPDRGANQTGDFTPTDPKTTDTSNDHGNRPSDGSVGKADDKNPPGQSHRPEDKNAGYECDRNKGIGKGNPAHSACTPTTSTTTTVKDTTLSTTVVKDEVKIGAAVSFEAQLGELKAKQTPVVAPTPEPEDLTPVDVDAQLAMTGGDTYGLAPIGIGLVIFGAVIVAATRKRPQHIAMELNRR